MVDSLLMVNPLHCCCGHQSPSWFCSHRYHSHDSRFCLRGTGFCSPTCPFYPKLPLTQNRLCTTYKGAVINALSPVTRNSLLSGSRLAKMDCTMHWTIAFNAGPIELFPLVSAFYAPLQDDSHAPLPSVYVPDPDPACRTSKTFIHIHLSTL